MTVLKQGPATKSKTAQNSDKNTVFRVKTDKQNPKGLNPSFVSISSLPSITLLLKVQFLHLLRQRQGEHNTPCFNNFNGQSWAHHKKVI